ncbi:sensor domain-containing diguanylate cyclase [Paraglaciecola sp. L1A13]|uniref:sensor domain-containing diguanylate cyclase n=1 Tax=Paraglaciecola sp. L1A13 TaxID=2686359 RepID=UPI00131B4437|nr:sensor domain-containing diguanylate cyclase [Paraglaciecola sp. L1A13]
MKSISGKIYIKVALAIAIGAIGTSLVTSVLLYVNAVSSEQNKAQALIEQIGATIRSTASIALYVQDQELGQEIVQGLVINDLIAGAKLSDSVSLDVSFGILSGSKGLIKTEVQHPFIPNQTIGELLIYPNRNYIQSIAKQNAINDALLLLLYSAIVALFVSVFVHKLLTQPLQKLTASFLKIDPRNTETMRTLIHNENDEIGQMVQGINDLMGELKSTLENETDLRIQTQALESKFRLIFEQASAGICLIDADNKISASNPAFNNMLPNSLTDTTFIELFEHVDQLASLLIRIRNEESVNHLSIDLKCKSLSGEKKKWVHCLFSRVTTQRSEVRQSDTGAQGPLIEVIMYDVTARVEKEHKTRFEADHDALTHLKNRRSGEAEIENLLQTVSFLDLSLVVFMIDLDNFKPVNDVHGHDAGDRVLIEVGKRLQSVFDGKNEFCSRWGGDEFVAAYVVNEVNIDEICALAQSTLDSLRYPIDISDDINCTIGGSIGVVIAPTHADNTKDLIACADKTMYQVKQNGRGHFEIFDPNWL